MGMPALRAPGSKVTLAPLVRAGSGASNNGSMRTLPVKYSAGPLPEDHEPHRRTSMVKLLSIETVAYLLAADEVNVTVAAASG